MRSNWGNKWGLDKISSHLKGKIGSRFYIIAPRGVFDFQQDYLDFDGTRFYAMRIPYSIINELHTKEFSALQQPNDELAVNDTVDSVGFDFIQTPKVEWSIAKAVNGSDGEPISTLTITKFESRARLRKEDIFGGKETFSSLMLDYDFKDNVFDFDQVVYQTELEANEWNVAIPVNQLGNNLMAVFLDIHGNEARQVISRADFLN